MGNLFYANIDPSLIQKEYEIRDNAVSNLYDIIAYS